MQKLLKTTNVVVVFHGELLCPPFCSGAILLILTFCLILSKQHLEKTTVISDLKTNENAQFNSLDFFVSFFNSPLLIPGIMLPLFSLQTIVLRRGKESCSISLSRTSLSVLGNSSTTGQLEPLVSTLCSLFWPFNSRFAEI